MVEERYERNILCQGFGEEQQLLLAEAKVLVVGAGGLGSYVLMHLAAAGVGTLAIAEYDVVSASNLNRQLLYTTDDISKPKIVCASKRLRAINPSINIVEYPMKIDEVSIADIIALYDIVVDCTDNYNVRYVMDDSCKRHSKPFVHGSVAGYVGSISVFTHRDGGVGYRDLFGDMQENAGKIGVLSPIVGSIGSLQAMEVIKLITSIGTLLSGTLLNIDILNNRYNRYNI